MGQYDRLAADIRAGAKLRPQCFGDLFGPVPGYDETGSCAVGAALEVNGYPLFRAGGYNVFRHTYAADTDDWLPCPADVTPRVETPLYLRYAEVIENGGGTLLHVIEFLNDYLHWTREAIAEYVEVNG